MIYLFDAELSENKPIFSSLTSIYGIGKSNSEALCKNLGFSRNLKIKDLSKTQLNELIAAVKSSKLVLAKDLKKRKHLITNNLIEIKSYRGLRGYQGLPVRGQRTHTNARTARKRR